MNGVIPPSWNRNSWLADGDGLRWEVDGRGGTAPEDLDKGEVEVAVGLLQQVPIGPVVPGLGAVAERPGRVGLGVVEDHEQQGPQLGVAERPHRGEDVVEALPQGSCPVEGSGGHEAPREALPSDPLVLVRQVLDSHALGQPRGDDGAGAGAADVVEPVAEHEVVAVVATQALLDLGQDLEAQHPADPAAVEGEEPLGTVVACELARLVAAVGGVDHDHRLVRAVEAQPADEVGGSPRAVSRRSVPHDQGVGSPAGQRRGLGDDPLVGPDEDGVAHRRRLDLVGEHADVDVGRRPRQQGAETVAPVGVGKGHRPRLELVGWQGQAEPDPGPTGQPFLGGDDVGAASPPADDRRPRPDLPLLECPPDLVGDPGDLISGEARLRPAGSVDHVTAHGHRGGGHSGGASPGSNISSQARHTPRNTSSDSRTASTRSGDSNEPANRDTPAMAA